MKGATGVLVLALCIAIGRTDSMEDLLTAEMLAKLEAGENPCSKIRYGQNICMDCEHMGFCMQYEDEWYTLPLFSCENGYSCSQDSGKCERSQTCDNAEYNFSFECQREGIYPDPYNCKFYHKCSAAMVDTWKTCPSGTSYSAVTSSCSDAYNEAECLEPKYKCNTIGEVNAWPDNANIFYLCYVKVVDNDYTLYPLLYRCPRDYIFDGYTCVRPETPPTTPTTTTVSTMECEGSKLTADPTNCSIYYVCKMGELKQYECPVGTYFLELYSACVFGSC